MATKTAMLMQKLRRQRLPPLPTVRDLLKMYDLGARRHLAQNFLLDEKLTSKICKAAGDLYDSTVIEIGPGPGSITRSILERQPRKLILIEKDKRFNYMMQMLEDACPGKIDVYWGDVMSFEMSKIIPQDLFMPWDDHPPKIHLIGNLPFNIATPLISRWFSQISSRSNAWTFGRVPLTLTFQKEVAERLCAAPSDEQRSRLSVMAESLTHRQLKFIIKGSAFVPKPDVDVGVVKFVPRKEPLINQPYKLVEKLVRQCFTMRNKYCCRGLSTLFPKMVRNEFTKMLFNISMVFPNTRPYDLAIEDYQRLCDAYAEISEKYPEVGEYNYRGITPDETFEKLYGAKYEAFRSEVRAPKTKPLDVISDYLRTECEEEIKADEDEEVVYIYDD